MRRFLVGLLIVLAVVGVGGVLADNYVRGRAEAQAAAALQSRLGLAEEPGVTIGGFPFSLSFLTRSVPSARVSVERVPVEVSGEKVTITGVLVDSDAIRLAGDTVKADAVRATGVLGYADLGTIAGVPVSYAGDGRIKLLYTAKVENLELTVGLTAEPRLDADAGVVRLAKLELDTDSKALPIGKARLQQIAKPIPVELPKGARLTAMTLAEGGIAIAAEATGLSLPLS